MQKELNFFKYYNPQAVVFLLEGQVSSSIVLTDIYDFTYTEKEVLRHALNGKSLIQISKIRGTSPETIKTQIRAIYSKTGTNNLAELRNLVIPSQLTSLI